MGADLGRKPLLSSRGLLLIDDFCRSSGLARSTVEELILTGRVEGVMTEKQPRGHALFDDLLPSRDALAAMGLPGGDDYDPEALRS